MLKRRLNSTRSLTLARAAFRGLMGLGAALLLGVSAPMAAETSRIPYFWDPQAPLERPDLSFLQDLRILTDDDYPPFGFKTAAGTLSGFNVDLARAICEELKLTCRIQARRWDKLIEALNAKEGDVLLASLAIRPANRKLVDFTAPYYRTPARFMALKDQNLDPDRTQSLSETFLSGKTIGVQTNTAHEAYVRQFFKSAPVRAYADQASLIAALRNREIDLIFGDGATFAIWLNQQAQSLCCSLIGGPYLESAYFGEGVGIAVRKQNPQLLHALNYALQRIAERGIYADLYLKYFPISFY
ncbi:MAG: ABC transporter substrate-binding protein [Alphaproteobacteria bacterium]|nr:ABC transporter substrate-binding protein [Alphaproteobacteria bacterium]